MSVSSASDALDLYLMQEEAAQRMTSARNKLDRRSASLPGIFLPMETSTSDTLEERLTSSALNQPYLTRKAILLAQEMAVSMEIEEPEPRQVHLSYLGYSHSSGWWDDPPQAQAHRSLRQRANSADQFRMKTSRPLSPQFRLQDSATRRRKLHLGGTRRTHSSSSSSTLSIGSSLEDCLEDAEEARKILESVGIGRRLSPGSAPQPQPQPKPEPEPEPASPLPDRSTQINYILSDIQRLCRVQDNVTAAVSAVEPRSISTSSLISNGSGSTGSQVSPPRILSPEAKAEVRQSIDSVSRQADVQKCIQACGGEAAQTLHNLNENLQKEVTLLHQNSENFLAESYSTQYLEKLLQDAQKVITTHTSTE